MDIAVIIPAAGASKRFTDSLTHEGLGDPFASRSKLDEDLGGRPVIQRTVELFTKLPEVRTIIVAGPHDAAAMDMFRSRHGDKLGLLGAQICTGGKDHRYETVMNALKLVPASCTHVAIHDAARPCASLELIERVFAAAQHHTAVVPGVDVPDTLKRVSEMLVDAPQDPLAGILGQSTKPLGRLVEQTVDRSRVVGVQTPQVFELSLLRRAYAQKDLQSTDDAQLVERLGEPVLIVAGESTNIKITRLEDVRLARAILGVKSGGERSASMRF
ncbi:MAG: 2-C-methyl-D-erythritol 4-phosphate cytidylyltransferase [Pyrinomonadaceae bacterium]|nr:2-C-methyl-D-erythritol 4-phosphate cytidylyltransferase [Phycisphaerales bacterium]